MLRKLRRSMVREKLWSKRGREEDAETRHASPTSFAERRTARWLNLDLPRKRVKASLVYGLIGPPNVSVRVSSTAAATSRRWRRRRSGFFFRRHDRSRFWRILSLARVFRGRSENALRSHDRWLCSSRRPSDYIRLWRMIIWRERCYHERCYL